MNRFTAYERFLHTQRSLPTGMAKAFQLGAEPLGRLALKVHKLHEFVDLRAEHFHRLLVDLHAVRLIVGLDLRDGARAATPRVQHFGKLHAFIQHLVHGGVNGRLFDVFGHAHDESAPVFEVRVEISLAGRRGGGI